MKVLIIEDDKQVATTFKNSLIAEHYSVEVVSAMAEALAKISEQYFHIILLNVSSAKLKGLNILKEIRESGCTIPILMISTANSLEEKIKGFNGGADDYLAKPIQMEELVARIKAIVRRSSASNLSTTLRCGDVSLNTLRQVVSKHGKEYPLTVKEYILLEYFIKNSNKILSRASIIQNVWNQNLDPDSNIIDVYVKRLRMKLEKDADPNPYIQSVRGIGYRFKEKITVTEDEE